MHAFLICMKFISKTVFNRNRKLFCKLYTTIYLRAPDMHATFTKENKFTRYNTFTTKSCKEYKFSCMKINRIITFKKRFVRPSH